MGTCGGEGEEETSQTNLNGVCEVQRTRKHDTFRNGGKLSTAKA